MRIGRWSELSVDMVCHEHEVMREVDANETSGELGSAFGGTLVGLSQLFIPKFDPLIESSILFPLVSVDLELVRVKITKDKGVRCRQKMFQIQI